MKYSKVLAATALSFSLALGGPAFATERAEQGRAVAVELSDHADPAIRAAALLTLGQGAGSEERAALEQFKNSENQQERLAAGMALMLAKDRSAVAFTAGQLKEAPRTFEVVRLMAAMLPADQLRAVINETLKDGPANVRRDIFRFLASQNGELYQVLTRHAQGKDQELRELAVRALAANPRKANLEVARMLATSRDVALRAQALEITRSLQGREDLRSELVEVLKPLLSESREGVNEKAARQLVALGDDSGTTFLVNALASKEGAQRPEVLRFLLSNSVRAELDKVRALIDELEAEQDYSSRQTERELLYALAATSGDSEFYEELRDKFRGDIFEHRLVAVQALGFTRNADAAALLEPALREGQAVIRKGAALGLGRLGATQALGGLRQAATHDRDKSVRIAAIEAIGQIRDAQSAQILRFLITTNDLEIKSAVTDSLSALAIPEVVPALESLLRDRNTDIQWKAFVGLLRTDTEAALRHAPTILRNPPQTLGADLNPTALSERAREGLYRLMLTSSNARVRSIAGQHVDTYRELFLPLARELVTSEKIHQSLRQELVLTLLAEGEDEDLAVFDQIMRNFSTEEAARTSAWTLARVAPANFEASFRGILARDASVLKAIAAYALSNMD